MIYLIVQVFLLLLLAGVLGLIFGWYLTRISAAQAHAKLRERLRTAEVDAHELRAELDLVTTAKSNADIERRLLSDELADMRARQDAAERSTDSDESMAALQIELEQCREALVAAASGGAAEKSEHEADSVAIASAAAAAAAASGARGLMAGMAKPESRVEDQEGADDLQQIKGIGPKIAGILQELGIQRFEQIATWTPEKVDWVNERLSFKGRIEREEWIPQAKALIAARDD
jgi:NADH-quinone oxidoreductase subunit E